jgi:Fe-Mn family superoxide dismutase
MSGCSKGDEVRTPYHVLPALPYGYGALEPWIDAETMHLHHDFHHRRCVEALNSIERHLAAAHDHANPSYIQQLERLAAWRGCEHRLHCLFWEVMAPDQGGHPRGELAEQIVEDFGGFADFKWWFSAVANNLTAGGWVVLAWHPERQRLLMMTAGRHDQQLEEPLIPLLALDVWTHAYCLKYGERRPEYVHNWWNTVHWPRVAQRFATALQQARAGAHPAEDGTAPKTGAALGQRPAQWAAALPTRGAATAKP